MLNFLRTSIKILPCVLCILNGEEHDDSCDGAPKIYPLLPPLREANSHGAAMESGVFRGVVQNILNRWSGLKMSVDHQSGGRQSKEKALYLVDYINEVLFTNNKVECEDLEDLISEYMDSELQTILEDDSVREVSKAILHLFDLFQTGKQEELVQEMNKLPPCDLWLDITYPTTGKQTESSDDCSSSNESETEETKGKGVEPMDCEWTQVTYRKKR